jgi:hypothetical protein
MASRPIEEQALREFLDSASSTPSALLVDGEAGIGKTTLWLAGLEQARGRGFRVLSAPRCKCAIRAGVRVAGRPAGRDVRIHMGRLA